MIEFSLTLIELWDNSFGGAKSFVWINNSDIIWPETETSAEKINETLENAAIHLDELFDEVVVAKAFWSSNCDTWKTNKLSCEEKWIQLFNHFKDKNISVPNLAELWSTFSAYQAFLFLLKGCSQ
jgi:hypothetical protein